MAWSGWFNDNVACSGWYACLVGHKSLEQRVSPHSHATDVCRLVQDGSFILADAAYIVSLWGEQGVKKKYIKIGEMPVRSSRRDTRFLEVRACIHKAS